MARRRLLALALGLGSLLGISFWRRRGRRRERVDLYFEDGSMVSIAGDAPEAALLLPRARDALRAVR